MSATDLAVFWSAFALGAVLCYVAWQLIVEWAEGALRRRRRRMIARQLDAVSRRRPLR